MKELKKTPSLQFLNFGTLKIEAFHLSYMYLYNFWYYETSGILKLKYICIDSSILYMPVPIELHNLTFSPIKSAL